MFTNGQPIGLLQSGAIPFQGMLDETFKDEYAGKDLKNALLALFNGIKDTHKVPEFMVISDICSIQKKNGSLLELESQRGISLITVFKKIFENLL